MSDIYAYALATNLKDGDMIDLEGDVYADPVTRARIARQEFAAERQTILPLNGTI